MASKNVLQHTVAKAGAGVSWAVSLHSQLRHNVCGAGRWMPGTLRRSCDAAVVRVKLLWCTPSPAVIAPCSSVLQVDAGYAAALSPQQQRSRSPTSFSAPPSPEPAAPVSSPHNK